MYFEEALWHSLRFSASGLMMSVTCTFVLNNKPMSVLSCPGAGIFAAFSGMPVDRDNPDKTADPGNGPLPLGRYYIVDRQSGGRLGWLYDIARKEWYGTDRSEWFALYHIGNDGKGSDDAFVGGVVRGRFRLHPMGPLRRSEGCITVVNGDGFKRLSTYLRGKGASLAVPGTSLRAYGVVEVRR